VPSAELVILCRDWFSALIAVGGVPPSRWIVNFDFNLLDSLVLAAILAAYAPFLVSMIVCFD